MNDDDRELFDRELSGVRPLKQDRVAPPVGARKPTLAQQARRAAAQALPGATHEPLSLPEQVAEVGPHDLLGQKKNGVQEGVYRKLRLGKYEPQARLDLHRVKLVEARLMVMDFIHGAYRQGLRTVLITHGKGQHSVTPGKMKSYVLHWLQEWDLVLAYHSAQPRHGGAGTTYVLLRKAPQAKQQTREHFHQP